MRSHVIALALFLVGGAARAQSPQPGLCPHPPCAPGFASFDHQGGTTVVKVKCWNTAIVDCYTVQLANGTVVTPDKVTPGMTGKVIVYDANGRPVGDPFSGKFERAETDPDGKTPVHVFTKQ